MGRIESDQDPLFARINASISFDRRLATHDVAQSRAHAAALRKLGVLDDDELAAVLSGLDQVATEIEAGSFPFSELDEDIHMAIERRLTELAGAVGGKLHTARSRNDQVATDLALFVRERAEHAISLLAELMRVLHRRAEEHRDWPAPSYTHLQRAQPIYLGHHLLAYFWMFARDASRFRFAAASAGEMPAGSGALAGLNWDLDRQGIADQLGFSHPAPNSLDAVSNRDFALDYLYAAAACATHLSRLGSEIVIFSSAEFGFCEGDDAFSSGSSIMPQKKNPDAAELLRGKAPRISSSLYSLMGILHALPLAYGKDLQEDKEPLFDAVDNLELCLEVAARMLDGLSFDRERLAAAAGDEMLAATDLADLLVGEGIPFREAHEQVGTLVRTAIAAGMQLSELGEAQIGEIAPATYRRFTEMLAGAGAGSAEAKISAGGTASPRIDEQLRQAAETLARLSA